MSLILEVFIFTVCNQEMLILIHITIYFGIIGAFITRIRIQQNLKLTQLNLKWFVAIQFNCVSFAGEV